MRRFGWIVFAHLLLLCSGGAGRLEALQSAPPTSPTGFGGVAQSTTAIQWSWGPSTGSSVITYEIHAVPETTPPTIIASGLASTSYLETGLNENTEYSRNVYAVASDGITKSAPSNVGTRYTLIHTATTSDFSVSATSSTSILIAVVPPPNSTAGQTGVEIVRNVPSQSAVSGPAQVYSATDSGLQPKTEYCYNIQFQNGDAVPSGFSPTSQCATTPSGDDTPCHQGFTTPGKNIFVEVVNGQSQPTRAPVPKDLDFQNFADVGHDAASAAFPDGALMLRARVKSFVFSDFFPTAATETNLAKKTLVLIDANATDCCHHFSVDASCAINGECAIELPLGKFTVMNADIGGNLSSIARLGRVRMEWTNCQGDKIALTQWVDVTLSVNGNRGDVMNPGGNHKFFAQGTLVRNTTLEINGETFDSPPEVQSLDIPAAPPNPKDTVFKQVFSSSTSVKRSSSSFLPSAVLSINSFGQASAQGSRPDPIGWNVKDITKKTSGASRAGCNVKVTSSTLSDIEDNITQ